jgi:MoaA/NifB/PqqE/SkfB family radical SAM enzyme
MDLLDDPNKIEKLLIAKAITNKIPLSASFELTPYCNFNCNMCFTLIPQHYYKIFFLST